MPNVGVRLSYLTLPSHVAEMCQKRAKSHKIKYASYLHATTLGESNKKKQQQEHDSVALFFFFLFLGAAFLFVIFFIDFM